MTVGQGQEAWRVSPCLSGIFTLVRIYERLLASFQPLALTFRDTFLP